MNVGACGGNLYDEEGNATTSFSRKYPSFLWELLGILYIPSLCFSSRRSLFFNHEGEADKGGFCYWCGFDGEEVGVIFDRGGLMRISS